MFLVIEGMSVTRSEEMQNSMEEGRKWGLYVSGIG